MGKLIAVIMGNGPSLNDMPPSLVRDYDTYGMNFAKYQPKFYVCVDETLLKNPPSEIRTLAKNAEIAYLSDYVKDWPNLYTGQLYSLPNVEIVKGESRGRGRPTADTGVPGAFKNEQWMSGGTATYVALKLAYYAGYDEVWLWGVDHSKDWKHYDPYYPDARVQGTEREYHMKMMLRHYWLAQSVYEKAGRRIVNFSDPSPLDSIFERGTDEQTKELEGL